MATTEARSVRVTPATAESRYKARLFAFYLPQFHPIPENDEWWGKGFTEWRKVVAARPLFRGHYQPRLPREVGFYDLRVPETRAYQAELAGSHGIEGFCYWHYWFGGRRLLERPFADVLASGEPEFPFCLAWANHSWTRGWTNDENSILMEQVYSPEDDLIHIHWLMEAFADPRYIRVGQRPLFVIYNPGHLPEPQRTTDLFRNECVRHGMPEPYLVGINLKHPEIDTRTIGFDATLDHEPKFLGIRGARYSGASKYKLLCNLKYGVLNARTKILDYEAAYQNALRTKMPYPTIPCVFVGWDTSPRRGPSSQVLTDATPKRFGAYLSAVVQECLETPFEERIIFINAWNEWGEGMHLEPDHKFGTGHLEAVKQVVLR